MFQVGLILENSELLAQLTALHVWGEDTGFQIAAVFNSFETLARGVREKSLDLLIVEAGLAASDHYETLDKVRDCCGTPVALCGPVGDFESAQQGIRHGVADYFTVPFAEAAFTALFVRLRDKLAESRGSAIQWAGELRFLFLRKDTELYRLSDDLCRRRLLAPAADSVVRAVFQQHEWMDLYLDEPDYLSENAEDAEEHRDKFIQLFESWLLLNPNHNDSLEPLLQYILLNPESDLRQKNLSEELHINKSYLSTVFMAQTGMRFVDYITNIKLMRAAWLLKNTDMKVGEIAVRLDYKDIAYFSKQFRKVFQLTPSAYRIPDHYQFQI